MRNTGVGRSFRLLRILLSENAAGYGIALGIIALIQFCLAVFTPDATVPARLFPILLSVAGCWMAAGAYHTWSGFGRSVFYLLLPATASEKYVAVVTGTTLVFLPVFTAVYWLSGYFFQSLFHANGFFSLLAGGIGTPDKILLFYLDSISIYLLLLPVFLYSAARFQRFSFAASMLILVILFILYNYWQLLLLYLFSGGLAFGHTFFIHSGDFNYYLFSGEKYRMETVNFTWWLMACNTGAWLLISILLHMAACFRLKERQR